MNVSDLQETWQVDVGGQIYQTNFDELAQWIFEGSLLPEDKVKRGNLRWIEARKIPSLGGIFAAKEQGLPMPAMPAAGTAQAPPSGAAPVWPPAQTSAPAAAACFVHAETAAEFQCEVCANYFCSGCLPPGSAAVCPLCGANGRRLSPPAPVFAPPPAAVFAPPAAAFALVETNAPPPRESEWAAPARRLPSELAQADRKKGPGLFISVIISLLLAGLAAYAWAYRFAAPDEAVENALPAVVTLDEKYKAEKEMEEMLAKQREAERRRAEELEKSRQTVSLSTGNQNYECRPGDKSLICSPGFEEFKKKQNEQFESMKKLDEQNKQALKNFEAQFAANAPDPLAAIESKYKSDRAKLIEKYRSEKASKSFMTTYVLSFLGLMIGFVAIRKIANR